VGEIGYNNFEGAATSYHFANCAPPNPPEPLGVVHCWHEYPTVGARYYAADGASTDQFGYSVAVGLDYGDVIVGAPYDDLTYTNAGTFWTEWQHL
jgi:hypothetical protein